MSTDHDDRANRDVSRAAQNAAIALLRNISIWRSLSILAEHVSESVPIGRDSIDLCRLLVEDKSGTMENESLQSQQAQNAIHQLLPRLMRQVRQKKYFIVSNKDWYRYFPPTLSGKK